MKSINRLLASLGITVICFVGASPAHASVAGYMQFVTGDVQLTTAEGKTHSVQKGDAVNEGDTLTSAKAASAQVKMQDGGLVAMRPDTRLKFDSFKFGGKEDGSEQSFYSLFRGGFRAITGLIGRINKPSYRITTPTSTIGIRGTDHETFVVAPGSEMAAIAPTGAYNKVNIGETYMATEKGTISVLPNQMGFAGAADQMPQLQPINIHIFTVAPAPLPQAGGGKQEDVRESAVVDTTAEAAGGGGNTPATIGTGNNTTLTPPAVVPVFAPAQLFDGVNPTATNLNFMSAEFNSLVGSHNAFNSVTGMSATFDAQGILTVLTGGLGYSRLNATTYEGGSDQGVIAWGRWAAGTPNLYGWGAVPLTVDQGFHMIAGQPVITPPQLDGVVYLFIGGTRPTEASNVASGNLWSVSGGRLTANFLSNTLSASLNLGLNNARQGNGTYVMSVMGSANPAAFNPVAGTVAYSGSVGNGSVVHACGTGGATCAATGTVMFAGATATHAGMTYEFSQANGVFVQGVAAFRR